MRCTKNHPTCRQLTSFYESCPGASEVAAGFLLAVTRTVVRFVGAFGIVSGGIDALDVHGARNLFCFVLTNLLSGVFVYCTHHSSSDSIWRRRFGVRTSMWRAQRRYGLQCGMFYTNTRKMAHGKRRRPRHKTVDRTLRTAAAVCKVHDESSLGCFGPKSILCSDSSVAHCHSHNAVCAGKTPNADDRLLGE